MPPVIALADDLPAVVRGRQCFVFAQGFLAQGFFAVFFFALVFSASFFFALLTRSFTIRLLQSATRAVHNGSLRRIFQRLSILVSIPILPGVSSCRSSANDSVNPPRCGSIPLGTRPMEPGGRSLSPALRCLIAMSVALVIGSLGFVDSTAHAQATTNTKKEKKEFPPPRPVKLRTKDGLELVAFYYPSSEGKKAITVMLLHEWQGQPSPYRDLTLALREAGCAVLLPTYRGHATKQNLHRSQRT